MTGDEQTTEQEALYSIHAAGATDDELAALIAILQVRSLTEKLKAGTDRPLAGGWKSYYRTIRQPAAPGREAWRTSIRF